MKILLATDAWHPQINGVVTTLSRVREYLTSQDHQVEMVATGDYPSLPLPTYPEIRISVAVRGLAQRIDAFDPDAIHICTEGPLGQKVRKFCLKRGYAFTTSFHTRFPEYLRERLPVPLDWSYAFIRHFHRPAYTTLVPTKTILEQLGKQQFRHLQVWGRGVDTKLFHPNRRQELHLPRPILLNVGRVAPEKNLGTFLDLDTPGSKVVVGDGPSLAFLRQKYPQVQFVGIRQGEALARYYASADVFVFPSTTDTFGLVMLEAIASGTPVAAFPVAGPIDVVTSGVNGILHEHLDTAILSALQLDRTICRNSALQHAWSAVGERLLNALVPVNSDKQHHVQSSNRRDRTRALNGGA